VLAIRKRAVHLIRLIYSSDARADLAYRDFVAIMTAAAERNDELGVTGILCYGGGKFLQALEGERIIINALYHRISVDPRHQHCQLMQVSDITEREFGEWSMKIVNWSDAITAAREASLIKHSGSSEFDPDNMSGEQADAFLRDLALAERLLLE
jgi:hypothetical protein